MKEKLNLTIETYVILVKRGKLTIEQVPEQYREEVRQALGVEE